ncbi:MAG: hypothetical protein CL874_01810 [Dehalococcoidales bacterium]|nr:hypothetical protein [Dehalococcoidales bacterium]
MATTRRATTRRRFLRWGAAGLAGWVLSTVLGQEKVYAQETVEAVSVAYPPLIVSRRVSQVPMDYLAPDWGLAEPLRIPLAPQTIVKPKETSETPQDLLVRSLFDEEKVGFLIETLEEWMGKETPEMPKQGIGRTDRYGDALALEIPADITRPIPYFGMGEMDNEVIIYQWKADWEFAPRYDVDEEFPAMVVDFYPYAGKGPGEMIEGADYGKEGKEWPADKVFNAGWAAGSPLSNPDLKEKTSVEKLVASGFGHLTSDSKQDGRGKAAWGHTWHVVITFPRKQDRYKIQPGWTIPVAFAAWHGHHGNRGGQKHISTWSSFVLERRGLNWQVTLAVAAAAVLGAVEWVIFRRRRGATRERSR